MSKRKTTGVPKKRREQDNAPAEGEQESLSLIEQFRRRAQDEDELQRMIWIAVGTIVGIIALLIVVGILWEQIITPSQTVATVEGDSISVAEFQERVRLERVIINQRLNNDIALLIELGQDPNAILQQEPYGTWWQEINSQPDLLGSRVLDEMIEEEIIRQQAADLGVTVDEQAVNEEVETFFNFFRPEETEEVPEDATETPVPSDTPTPFVSPTPSSTPAPTNTPTATPTPLVTEEAEATEETTDAEPTTTPRPTGTPSPTPSFEDREVAFNDTVQTFYRNAQREAELNEATVRGYFEYQALLSGLRDVVTTDVERVAPYVNVRHILVDTEEEANNVLAALEEGESFADLARAVSTDTGSGGRGGELGWSPASQYVAEFRDATLEAEIGAVVGPVESQFGFHIIQVRDREERELSDSEYDQARSQAFQEWLGEVTDPENYEAERRDNWFNFVPAEPAFVYRPPGIEETQPQTEEDAETTDGT